MKKLLLGLMLVVLGIGSLSAQDKSKPYSNGVGGMVGFINGFTYKGFPLYNFAIQLDAGLSYNFGMVAGKPNDWGIGFNGKLNVNFMYQGQSKQALYWLIGAGLNTGVGFAPENHYWKGSLLHGASLYPHYPFFFGINLITGFEYKNPKKNFAFQFDVRPGVYFYSHKENVDTRGFTNNYSFKTDFIPALDLNVLNLQFRYTIVKKKKGRSTVKKGGSIKTAGMWTK